MYNSVFQDKIIWTIYHELSLQTKGKSYSLHQRKVTKKTSSAAKQKKSGKAASEQHFYLIMGQVKSHNNIVWFQLGLNDFEKISNCDYFDWCCNCNIICDIRGNDNFLHHSHFNWKTLTWLWCDLCGDLYQITFSWVCRIWCVGQDISAVRPYLI